MKQKKSAYLITKPLQYINATNIPDDNNKDCFIVDDFKGSKIFYENISKKSSYWDEKYYLQKRRNFYIFILKNKRKYKNIYMDSDQGFLAFIFSLIVLPIKIYTYEEGYGSYRELRDGTKLIEKIKINIYKLLGSNNWFGGGTFTKGMFLYHPESFNNLVPKNKKKIYPFRKNFIDHANLLMKELGSLFDSKILDIIKNRDVILYLSSWEINVEVYNIIEQYPGHFTIIKPHPNIKNNIKLDNFDYILNSILPAELYIHQILMRCKNLIIVHENSSSLIYVGNIKCTEINLKVADHSFIIYNKIRELLSS